MAAGKPVVEGLFVETDEGPRLLGSRCANCGTAYFPKGAICHNPDCGESKMQDAAFGPRGKVWSVAIQSYPPPPPAKYDEPFKPYAMAVVDLDDGLRVLGRISGQDLTVEPGADVELVFEPLCHEPDGTPVLTWMFRPVGSR